MTLETALPLALRAPSWAKQRAVQASAHVTQVMAESSARAAMDRFVCGPLGPLLRASPQSELPRIVAIQTLEQDAKHASHVGHSQSVV